LNGSVYVVDAVAIRPTRLVLTASAARTVRGSSAVRDIFAQRELVRKEDRIEQPRFRVLRQRLVVANIGQR